MTPLAAYLLLFVAVGIGFIFAHLMLGKVIRPNKPEPGKETIYECGEPTIGSAWIQFDLRFYVIALLFVIFDVEVAFFFPWAVVFGKANSLASAGPATTPEVYHETGERAWELMPPSKRSTFGDKHDQMLAVTAQDLEELKQLRQERENVGQNVTQMPEGRRSQLAELEFRENMVVQSQEQARFLAWVALGEMAVFFGVLLVGFAYLWHRGDLAWVRSLAAERSAGELVPGSPALATRAETVAHT